MKTVAKKKYVNKKWMEEYLSIPAKYRCNPFKISPSGDLFFADKRNLDHIDEAIREAKEGKVVAMKEGQTIKDFLKELCTE